MWIIALLCVVALALIWKYIVQYLPEKRKKRVKDNTLQNQIYKIVHLNLDERVVHSAAEKVLRRSDLSAVPASALPLLKKEMIEGLKFYLILRAKYPNEDIVLLSDAIYELVKALEQDMRHFKKMQKYIFGRVINIDQPKELFEYRDGVSGQKIPSNIQKTIDLIIKESHGNTHALLTLDKRINNRQGFIWNNAQ